MRHPLALYTATDGQTVKIGISVNTAMRLKQLGPGMRFLEMWLRPWAKAIESDIKGAFSGLRARGNEWFSVPEAEFLSNVRRAVRIYDDDEAMKRGLEPSKRPGDGEPPVVPPYELSWLKTAVR